MGVLLKIFWNGNLVTKSMQKSLDTGLQKAIIADGYSSLSKSTFGVSVTQTFFIKSERIG